METKRLFVGLHLSPLLTKRLIREMEAFSHWPVILTRKNNLHVTVLFLGFAAEEYLSDILEAIEISVAAVSPFELHFTEIGFFPDQEHPTHIFLSGEPNDGLLQLRQQLDTNLGYLVPEKKSFRPHVTLAKIRRGQFEKLPEKPTLHKTVNFVEPVSMVTLFESTTEEGKRVYLPLGEFPLGEETLHT